MKPTVTYSINIEQDDEGPEGAFASGNDEADKKLIEDIYHRLNQGDTWAWCMVKVIAECEGFRGFDTLCGCSYKDEADFKAGGYYEQMCSEALEDLKRNLAKAQVEGGRAGWTLEQLKEG